MHLKETQMHVERPYQEIVRRQALERLQAQVKALEQESERARSDRAANMAQMDHHTLARREERRQTQLEIQTYLLAQMKQKKDAASFNSNERLNFKADWQVSAPEETFDHQLKVSDLTARRMREQQAAHREQLNERRAMQAQLRSADRSSFNEMVDREQTTLKSSMQVTEARKKEVLARQQAVWSEQISLSKRHKLLMK